MSKDQNQGKACLGKEGQVHDKNRGPARRWATSRISCRRYAGMIRSLRMAAAPGIDDDCLTSSGGVRPSNRLRRSAGGEVVVQVTRLGEKWPKDQERCVERLSSSLKTGRE